MNWKPNKWIAATLGLLLQPVGLLYVARPQWAASYLIVLIALGAVMIGFITRGVEIFSLNVLSAAIALAAAVHSYFLASKSSARTTRPAYTRWYCLAGIMLSAVAFVFLLRAFIAEPFRARASSMEPSVPVGSYLLVSKWGYGHYSTYGITLMRSRINVPLARADLVVFDYPERPKLTYVKRIIGLPGDKVAYRDKRLSINGVPVRTTAIDASTESKGGSQTHRQYSEELGASPHLVMFDDFFSPIRLANVRNFSSRVKCVYEDSGFMCEVQAGNYFVMGDNRDNSEDSRYWGFVPESAVIGKVSHIFVPSNKQ
jgi:signal peptidase I